MDHWGPVDPKGWKGQRHVLTIQEAHSKYVEIKCCKTKNDIDAIISIMEKWQRITEKRIKYVRSDCAPAFLSKIWKSYLNKKGITQTLTIPGHSFINGRCERVQQTIETKSRVMLESARIPGRFWTYAVRWAVYLYNRTPHSANPNFATPLQLFDPNAPPMDLKKIYAFGAPVSVLKTKNDRVTGQKTTNPTDYGFFLGISEKNQGAIVYLPHRRTVVYRRTIAALSEDTTYEAKLKELREQQAPNDEDIQTDEQFDEVDKGHAHILEEENEGPRRQRKRVITYAERDGQQRMLDYYAKLAKTKSPTISNSNNNSNNSNNNNSNNNNNNSTSLATFANRIHWHQIKDDIEWHKSFLEEIDSMEENQTFKLVTEKDGMTLIRANPIFKVKTDAKGVEVRKKTRICADGSRMNSPSYATYAPTSDILTSRLILVKCVKTKIRGMQADSKNAFLKSKMPKNIKVYLKPAKAIMDVLRRRRPKEYQTKWKGKVWLLKKSLYGLDISPNLWYNLVKAILASLNIYPSEDNPALYASKERNIIINSHVDDFLLWSNNQKILGKIKKTLKEKIQMTFEPATYYLQQKIDWNQQNTEVTLSATKLIDKVQRNPQMLARQKTPMDPKIPKEKFENEKIIANPKIIKNWQERVGRLGYIGRTIRPEAAFSINWLSRQTFSITPTKIKALQRVEKYLETNKSYGMEIRANHSHNIDIYTDSDLATGPTAKSTSGYVFLYDRNIIQYKSTTQKIIALSSTEAEMIAAVTAMKDAIYIIKMIRFINLPMEKITLHIDNQSTIRILQNNKYNGRCKHLQLRWAKIRELIYTGIIINDDDNVGKLELKYVPTEENIADCLTKALAYPKFAKFRDRIIIKQ